MQIVNDIPIPVEFIQERYDFKPNNLTGDEILEIKNLAREKRSSYGMAPISTNIFAYLKETNSNLYFETEPFDNSDLDALIYVPNIASEATFVIINSKQPLLNQIFAVAHEYYHYLRDLTEIRVNPRACSLSKLDEKTEQKASRFAAEFLLPTDALRIDYDNWSNAIKKKVGFPEMATISYLLSVKYGMPLKATLFRLLEEDYIKQKDFSTYHENYSFLKTLFQEIVIKHNKKYAELLGNENPYLEETMYEIMTKVYNAGNISIDRLEKDIEDLSLDKDRFLCLNDKSWELDDDQDDDI